MGRASAGAFSFPAAAIRCLRALRRLSSGGMLFLSADKGYHAESALTDRGDPGIAVHGSFSMSVNHHAIGEYFRDAGGEALFSPNQHAHIDVAAFHLGLDVDGGGELGRAFEDAVVTGGPDDFFTLKQVVARAYDRLSAEELLAWIRLSGYDANIVRGCLPALRVRLDGASEEMTGELARVLERVWAHYLPLGEEDDLAFLLGLLLYELVEHAAALPFFERSLALYGPDAGTLYDAAACHHALGRDDLAAPLLEQALTLAPDFDLAARLRERIAAP